MNTNNIIALILAILVTLAFFLKTKPSKVINMLTFLIAIQLIFFVSILFIGGYSLNKSILVSSGYSAFLLFTYTLHIGPLARLTKFKIFKRSLALRRDLGVSVFLLSLYHYLLNWSLNFGWDYSVVQSYIESGSNYGRGIQIALPAFMILTLVALISNKWSIKKLTRKIWKYLQLLVYPAYILVGFHIILLGSIFASNLTLQIIVSLLFISSWVVKAFDIYKTWNRKKLKAAANNI